MTDPLLDRPNGAPDWLPTVDQITQMRWFKWVLVTVLIIGVGACVVRSADRPADPVLGQTDGELDAPELPSAESGNGAVAARLATMEHRTVTVTNDDGSESTYCVLVADEQEQRRDGLMDVTEFSDFDGMLFGFDTDADTPFYMFQTPTPLTITWWRGDETYVSGAVMEPCLDLPADQCARYPAVGPYRYALELPTGRYDGVTVDERSRLRIGEPGCTTT